jgi:flagellin
MVTSNRNILGLGIARQIGQQSTRVNRILGQMASAERITSFRVDAAGGAVATRLESAFRGLSAQIADDQTEFNRLATQDAGMGGITKELQAIRDLQVQAGNGALAAEDVAALQAEADQRVQNIRGLVQNTQFAGTALIEPVQGGQLAGIIENGVDVLAAPATTDAVLNEVATARSSIGSAMNAVESRIAERQNVFENTVSSYSRLADTDMAETATGLLNSQAVARMSVTSLRNLFVFNRQNAIQLLSNL